MSEFKGGKNRNSKSETNSKVQDQNDRNIEGLTEMGCDQRTQKGQAVTGELTQRVHIVDTVSQKQNETDRFGEEPPARSNTCMYTYSEPGSSRSGLVTWGRRGTPDRPRALAVLSIRLSIAVATLIEMMGASSRGSHGK
jgi:hypothetical protein